MSIDHDQLIEERNEQYGEAYAVTDRWIKENLGLLAASPSPFSLIMIQNKLTRALATPLKQDHYDDIIGYTKLILRELERATTTESMVTREDMRSTFVKERIRFNDP